MTVDRTDPYAALRLTPNATQSQIRHAYRTLLRQHHPDTRVRGGDPTDNDPTDNDPTDNAASDTTLQQVIAAYAILGDPALRAAHDHATRPPQASTPTRVRTGMPFPRSAPDQPPIQAGPVRWHGRRR